MENVQTQNYFRNRRIVLKVSQSKRIGCTFIQAQVSTNSYVFHEIPQILKVLTVSLEGNFQRNFRNC